MKTTKHTLYTYVSTTYECYNSTNTLVHIELIVDNTNDRGFTLFHVDKFV